MYRRAGRDAESLQYWQKAHTAYRQVGDAVGLAVCEMMRGDWLSAPYSSPPLMNFLLLESGSEGSELGGLFESMEGNRDGLDLAGAREAYGAAEHLFGQERSSRPRRAPTPPRLAISSGRHFQSAVERTEEACSAFDRCGDLFGYNLSRTHLAIHRAGAGHRPASSELTAAVGIWGKERGSFSYALGLGLLASRAGRHWLTRRGDFERAQLCQRVAEALFETLGASSNLSQCLVDRGCAHQALSDYPAALTLFEEALEAMEEASRMQPALAQTLRQRIIMLANSLYQLCQLQMDVEGMARSAQRLEAQLALLPPSDDDAAQLAAMQENLFAKISTLDKFSLSQPRPSPSTRRPQRCRRTPPSCNTPFLERSCLAG